MVSFTEENIVGKEENAGNKQFLLLSQCFLPVHKQKQIFKQDLIFISYALDIRWSKVLLSANELTDMLDNHVS